MENSQLKQIENWFGQLNQKIDKMTLEYLEKEIGFMRKDIKEINQRDKVTQKEIELLKFNLERMKNDPNFPKKLNARLSAAELAIQELERKIGRHNPLNPYNSSP